MEPYYADERVTVYAGDCLDVLRELDDASVDAVVTDPPYGLEFMGKEWDGADGFRRSLNPADAGRDSVFGRTSRTSPEYRALHTFQHWCELWAAECLRVLKPGGHMLAFGGPRTWHRLASAIEDAGFEVRDSIAWLYGSGFPKSLDVSKAIDKRRDWTALPKLQAKVREARKTLGISQSEAARRVGLIAPDESLGGGGFMWFETGMRIPTREQYPRLKAALSLDDECDRAFEEAEREITGTVDEWQNRTNYALTSRDGFRRDAPATDDARTWQGWGTALKPAFEPIVVARKPLTGTVAANVLAHGTGALNIGGCRIEHASAADLAASQAKNPGRDDTFTSDTYGAGRPQQSVNAAGRWPANVALDESQAAALDAMTGEQRDGVAVNRNRTPDNDRAYYSAYQFGNVRGGDVGYGNGGGASRFFYTAKAPGTERVKLNGTAHPTVKPLDLMRWLVRLVTPPSGRVLDPFAGSGTTVEACLLEGFRCVAIEREPDYLPLIMQRVNRRIDPVAAVKATDDDGGLFDLLGEEIA